MTIAYLVPSANASPATILSTNTYTLIDDGGTNGLVADADGSVNTTGSDEQTGTATWALTDLTETPTSVSSATFRVRARLVCPANNDDTGTWQFRLSVGGSTYDINWVATTDNNAGFANRTIAVGTGFTKAQYDAATVTLDQTAYSRTKGGDGFYIDIDAFELEIDYSVLTPAFYDQADFHWRDDDGSESAATFITGDEPDVWTQATTPSFSTTAIYGVTYGNGLYVAVGTGKIAYSTDAGVWTQAATPSFSTDVIRGVAYGSGLYVAVGNSGKIAYSTDADTWTQATTPSFSTSSIQDVTYGNGTYVAVGVSGKIAYSTDGDAWTQSTTPSFSTDTINGVTFGNGLYVAVGGSGKIAYSTDGDTWTQATTPSFGTASIYGVTYGNGLYVAVGNGGKIGYSTDANTWTQATTPSFSTTQIYGVTYGSGLYVAVSSIGKIAYSSDGDTWTQAATPSFGTDVIRGVAYGNGLYVAVSDAGKIGWSPSNRTTFSGSDEAEYEFTIELVAADLTAGDRLQFRLKT